MGAIRINLANGTDYLLSINPNAVYSVDGASTTQVGIKESIGGSDIVYSISFVDANDKWDDFLSNGLAILEKVAPNPGFTGSLAGYIAPTIIDAIERAMQGDTVVDLAFAVPSVDNTFMPLFDDCRAKANDEVANFSAQLTQQISEASKIGQTEFRLPEGGGIVVIADWTSEDTEAYGKSIYGNDANCADKYIKYETMSIFDSVTITN